MGQTETVRLWEAIIGSAGAYLAALGIAVGIPVSAVRFDDPDRLGWLAFVPIFAGLGMLGLIREPHSLDVCDSGMKVRWLGRSQWVDRAEMLAVVVPKHTSLLGEGLTLVLQQGQKVELPNGQGRILDTLCARFPELAVDQSDSSYLSS